MNKSLNSANDPQRANAEGRHSEAQLAAGTSLPSFSHHASAAGTSEASTPCCEARAQLLPETQTATLPEVAVA